MSLADFRELTNEELKETLMEAKEERFNLRFQVATNQLDNTARLKTVKKEIAQILTILRERDLASPAEADAVVPAGAPAGNAKESA